MAASNIPVIVQGNSFSLAIPLQIYVIGEGSMVLQDYTPGPTDQVSIQLKGSRRQYTYAPTIQGNTAFIDLSGNEMADNYGVVVSIVKADGSRLRSFRTDQFFIVESSDDLTPDDIIEGLENNVIYLNSQAFVAGEDGRGIDSIVKTSTSGLVDTYTIYYSDNTTSTFQVTNGAQGADGVGIASIAKTSTSGLVDTYTITLENGSTSTFQVTNGRDGVDLGLAEIVNDFETGGTDKVLSAEMGKVIMYGADEMVNVDYEITQNGKKKGAAVGSMATETSDASFGYIEIPVSVGDVFVILAKGSSSGGGTYELTDSQHIVLEKSTTAFNNLPTMVTIANDGYIIINNQFTALASPKVTKLGGYVGEFTLDSGAYISCASVGGTAAKTAIASWSCAYVPLLAGQKITIYTKGGNNGRAWAICDNVRRVLSNAAANTDTTGTPVILNIESNCFVAINNSGYSSPKYVIEGGVAEQQPNLTDHEERIEALEEDVAALTTKKPLKILALGNSFTGNAMEYMSSFLTNLNVNVADLVIYKVEIGGSSLQYWWETCYVGNATISPAKIYGDAIADIGSTLKALLAHDWDYITFQQVSDNSANFATYEPYLRNLIAHVRKLCTNTNVKVAWHMTWSWATLNTGNGPKGADGFNSIASAVESMLDSYRDAGIDVVIPSGCAIQNARGTTLNNEAELTTDYKHASSGVARYIITATWYETLISKFIGKSAMGSTMTISATPSSSDLGAESVTDSNRNLCLMCVEYAIANPYNISTVVE